MNNFLNKTNLNDIELKVANLHKLFRDKYKIKETHLRNIEIGDNLSNKKLYLNFPWEAYENINGYNKFIIVDDKQFLSYLGNNASEEKFIYYMYLNMSMRLYSKNNNDINNSINYIRYKLPEEYGVVSFVDKNDEFYKYIKIEDDEYKLLEYNKKSWDSNEIPYLQNIDNIEQGIESVANILFKPKEYEEKQWTTLGFFDIENSDYGLAQKPISSKDFDRWNKNIKLLESIIDSIFCIWNVVSYIDWDNDSQFEFEWEEN